MSRQQWGHGYYTGYEDGRNDALNGKYDFADEVIYWCLDMCINNCYKTYHKTLFPVSEFISTLFFKTTMSMAKCVAYAEKIYEWVARNSHNWQVTYKDKHFWFYITGNPNDDWKNDSFVVQPIGKNQIDSYYKWRDSLEEKLRFNQ